MTETPERPGAPEAPTGPPGGSQPPAVPPPAAPPTAVGPAADYPVHLDVDRQEDYSRFMPLIKWLLVIPHLIVLFFLDIAASIVAFITFFAVLFTGRYPEGMFKFMVGVGRWTVRVYAYRGLMIDPYPPFTLDDDPSYPARFDIEYPEHVERWRVLQILLVIPYAFVASFVYLLAELMILFAFFTILFTRNYPEELFNITRIGFRWIARGSAYGLWMVRKYPPFVWD
jgi:Domain of unknown function (DUF4389)